MIEPLAPRFLVRARDTTWARPSGLTLFGTPMLTFRNRSLKDFDIKKVAFFFTSRVSKITLVTSGWLLGHSKSSQIGSYQQIFSGHWLEYHKNLNFCCTSSQVPFLIKIEFIFTGNLRFSLISSGIV